MLVGSIRGGRLFWAVAPALSERQIVALARVVPIAEVARDEAADLPRFYVGVKWPDGSRWIAATCVDGDIPSHELLDAYRAGRQVLEEIALRHLDPAGSA